MDRFKLTLYFSLISLTLLTSLVLCFTPTKNHRTPSRQQKHISTKQNEFHLQNLEVTRKNKSKLFQTPSIPTFDELSQQKSEALRSISEFHDGTWICESGAISSDISGGSIMRSPPFKTSISTRLGLAADNGETLKLVETLSWGQNGSESDDTFFGRSCSLGVSTDVDAIDGSYSLHSSIQNNPSTENSAPSCVLPELISGVADPETRTTSVIESCIVATQTERVRCFMIYGKSGMVLEGEESDGDENVINEQRLLRIVISHETKAKKDDALDDFIQSSVSAAENRADRLSAAMSGSSEDLGQNVKYPINMMNLSLGPWLGDIIIRDRSFNSLLPTSKKGNTPIGFGTPKQKKSRGKNKNDESGFGEWVLGVQKLAMTFKYDFDCNVRHTFDYGKSMGIYEEGWPRQSSGVIYDDRMSRRIKPEDRSMYIDYDNGAYCGYIFGCVYAKAPRFLTRQRQGSALPMLTEFAIFQEPENGVDADGVIEIHDEVCCSRITRLYNDDGTLNQGSSSFFILKPIVDETPLEP